MYGVVLKALDRTGEAIAALVDAVWAFPLNWSAWLDLATMMRDKAQVDALALPPHWASDLFRAHAYCEVQANNAALQLYEPLSAVFPNAGYVQAQVSEGAREGRNPWCRWMWLPGFLAGGGSHPMPRLGPWLG